MASLSAYFWFIRKCSLFHWIYFEKKNVHEHSLIRPVTPYSHNFMNSITPDKNNHFYCFWQLRDTKLVLFIFLYKYKYKYIKYIKYINDFTWLKHIILIICCFNFDFSLCCRFDMLHMLNWVGEQIWCEMSVKR